MARKVGLGAKKGKGRAYIGHITKGGLLGKQGTYNKHTVGFKKVGGPTMVSGQGRYNKYAQKGGRSKPA